MECRGDQTICVRLRELSKGNQDTDSRNLRRTFFRFSKSELTDASEAAAEVLVVDAPLLVPELTLGLDLPVHRPGLTVEDPIRLGVLAVVVDLRSYGEGKVKKMPGNIFYTPFLSQFEISAKAAKFITPSPFVDQP